MEDKQAEGRQGETLSRGMASREAILKAAITVVGRDGLPKASLGAIAREAGTSKPAVLYHFGSREKLLREMTQRALDVLQTRIVDGADHGGTDGIERVIGAIDAIFAKESRELLASVRELITLGIRDPVVGESVTKAYGNVTQLLAEVLPDDRSDDPHLADDSTHAITGFVQRWLVSGQEDPGPFRAGAIRVYARMAGVRAPTS